MSLIECYWMHQNSRVIAFTVFELLRENQLGGGKINPQPPLRLGLKRMKLPFISRSINGLGRCYGKWIEMT